MEHITEIELLDLIGDYLTESRKTECLNHIDICPMCQERHSQLNSAWVDLGLLEIEPSDKDVHNQVIKNITSNNYTSKTPWTRELIRIAASVLIAVLIGYLAGKKTVKPSQQILAAATVDAMYLDVLAPQSSTGWNVTVLAADINEKMQSR